MGIARQPDYQPLAMEGDPDDYRPDSELAIVIDPSRGDGQVVEDLTVFRERIAPGDRIPLHLHAIDEVLFVDDGRIEVRLGDDTRAVGRGAIVFVPAHVPHGFRNVGDDTAAIHAVFPSRQISIRYLERNPAPGTEGRPPGPPLAIDVRELVEGDPAVAIEQIDPSRIRPRTN